MTSRKTGTTQDPKPRKKLSLTRRTLKDLSVGRDGPKGGFLMKDSVIVRTGR